MEEKNEINLQISEITRNQDKHGTSCTSIDCRLL